MHKRRRRSMPATPLPSASSPPSPFTDTSCQPRPPGQHDDRLQSRAEALAKMTLELNLRSVSVLAHGLEKEVQQLVAVTNDNSQFRQRHEQRIAQVWREILAVKASIAEHGLGSVAARESAHTLHHLGALEQRCKDDATTLRNDLTTEIAQLKGLFDNMAAKLHHLSSALDAASMNPAQRPSNATQASKPAQASPRNKAPRHSPKQRLGEAISSTRRWHRDHKTTKLQDGPFVASYLRQQSKRDPVLAVMIQKAIHRRIQSRHGHYTALRPRSLDDFCRHVEWDDVIDTVKQELIKNEHQVIAVLSRSADQIS
ncbi:hypothetical protein CDD81_2175 [Ophiocordyceps australis]|uniref:Uncharacterized protein n=1 Tax=Ophiocordyceps australis TaxID=1399860 RepID=A0A2C5XX95_9HYPO|nr:hypothetical protein CDD81_2175 [Ophiocordyceps australis]